MGQNFVGIDRVRIAHEAVELVGGLHHLGDRLDTTEVADREAELDGELRFIRRTFQARLEPPHRGFELSPATPHRARHPVELTQAVEDRASNAQLGIGRETNAFRLVKSRRGIE